MQLGNRAREWTLVALVLLTALIANLPEDTLIRFDIQRSYVLAVLAVVVFLALFLYLKFQFFFLVVLLALGANLPAQVSDSLGISRWPLLIALVLLVGVSLINYVVALLPTGLEPKAKHKSIEGVRALFYAIEKGNLVYAQKVLSMNFDPNVAADNGYTPLMYAALRGDAKMADLLVRNSADVGIATKDGETAVELAMKSGSSDTAEVLRLARSNQVTRSEAMKPRTAGQAA